jgi:hypothetical protein
MTRINRPASPKGLNLEELRSSLLLIEALRFEANVQTSYGEMDAVACHVFVVDGEHAGERFRDKLIFPKMLVSQLKGQVGTGEYTCGRLIKGVALKKGQSDPWLIDDPSDADLEAAAKFLDGGPIGNGKLGETTESAPPVDDEPSDDEPSDDDEPIF